MLFEAAVSSRMRMEDYEELISKHLVHAIKF